MCQAALLFSEGSHTKLLSSRGSTNEQRQCAKSEATKGPGNSGDKAVQNSLFHYSALCLTKPLTLYQVFGSSSITKQMLELRGRVKSLLLVQLCGSMFCTSY